MIPVKPSKLSPNRLLPVSSIGNTFSSFFPYLFNWIYTPRQKIDWYTETRYPLTSRILWEKHQDNRQIIGVRFGDQTEYCMIDIDRKSPNHPLNSSKNFDLVLKACASIGLLEPLMVRSSASEGLHLYFPLSYQVNTFSLACALRYTLESHRLEIASGILETFPNTKAYNSEYNAHRLPLQDGSYLVRNDLYPITNSIETFCSKWFDVAECQDLELLTEQMAIARALHKPKHVNTAKLNDWKDELETILSQGWTGSGQTNDLLHKVAQYARVFIGFTDLDRLINWVTDKVTQLNGFNQFCGHKADLLRRVRDWCKWVMNRNYPMGDKEAGEEMAQKFREKQREETAQRIKEAANSLSDRNGDTMPIRQMAKAIAKQARCSQSTLYANLSLWHPEHKDCVTPNINDSQADLELTNQQQETARSESTSTVTHNHYEVLARDSTPPNSSKFDTPPFQPLTPVARLMHSAKIKLLEAQILARQQGRPTSTSLQEIEQFKAQIANLKS